MQTLKDFCKANSVKMISNVKLSAQNKVPYSTFVFEDTTENIYFSKNASELIKEGDSPKAFRDLYINLVEYTDGRASRLKIVSASDYVNVDDLWL
jgi:hypothetical protein